MANLNSEKILKKSSKFAGITGPLVCIVMDGIGLAPDCAGNAVNLANTPTLDYLFKNCEWRKLKAHGTAVGLPSDDDMGNSEVGHNAMGAGQVFAQGAKLVSKSIESGAMFNSQTWQELIKTQQTLHFIGLFSDGNVHSHIDHLEAMINHAKQDGVKKVRVHILLDGRDVGETSAPLYIERFEKFLTSVNCESFDAKIASGGGRMNITMDRYGANWKMVEKGWKTHVLGEGRKFASAMQAVETLRAETKAIDQDLDAFIIEDSNNNEPIGKIIDGDSVIFFNFRGDRAIEISTAFDSDKNSSFDKERFDRIFVPKVVYAGMLEYDGDLHIPKKYLVNPPEITNTLGEYLANMNVNQLAVSETQKFGHVTYFWNGNKSGKFSEEFETYVEIKSDVVPFEQRPWMKAAEITDVLLENIASNKFKFIRANFPNGDMVGHTGNLAATIIGVESVDLMLARIIKAVKAANGALIITADHGNADEMYELDKKGSPALAKDGSFKARTAHTLNAVPCIFLDDNMNGKYKIKSGEFGLSNLAATFANLLGYEAVDVWEESMIEF